MKKIVLIWIIFTLGCSPKTAEQFIKLGDRQKSFAMKERNYEKALELDSLNLKASNRIGYLYMYSKNPNELDKSRKYFMKVLEIDSNNVTSLFGIGETYKTEAMKNDSVNVNTLERAIYFYSKAIMIDSNDVSAIYQRDYSYHYINDSINCYKDNKRACDLGFNTSCSVIEKEHNQK